MSAPANRQGAPKRAENAREAGNRDSMTAHRIEWRASAHRKAVKADLPYRFRRLQNIVPKLMSE
jgi:hypothetical protein